MKLLKSFTDWAIAEGWQLSESTLLKDIPTELNERYPGIPSDYIDFARKLELCVSPDEKSWFLTLTDFNGNSDSAFKWNEIELMCTEAAENDLEWKDEISSFWDNHIPIMLSVKDGYSFFAIRLNSDNYGSVVHGEEPEFEDTDIVAKSFGDFLENFVQKGRI